MKYKKIETEEIAGSLRRDVISYRKYFVNGRNGVLCLSLPINGFHSLTFLHGRDFKRSRNRKRYIINFWKHQAYSHFYKLWDNV